MIDLHVHLDLYPKPHATAKECIARRLYILSVTTTPTAWAGTVALTKGEKGIRTALGLHPQIAHERKGELGLFEELLPKVRYVGEIGLDGGWEYRRHWRAQQRVFTRILELCEAAGGRIMTLHSRRAATEVLDGLSAFPDAGTPILHWFSGTQREVTRAVDMGCWFSVGPAMLNGARGRHLALRMPRDRVLTESDGPFAQIDGRSVWPWDVAWAIKSLAELWSEPIETVEQQLRENLKRLSAGCSDLAGTQEMHSSRCGT